MTRQEQRIGSTRVSPPPPWQPTGRLSCRGAAFGVNGQERLAISTNMCFFTNNFASNIIEHPHPLWVEILWALQGHCKLGQFRNTLELGTPGTLSGWALQGHSGVGHSRDERTPHRGWGTKSPKNPMKATRAPHGSTISHWIRASASFLPAFTKRRADSETELGLNSAEEH